MQENIDFMKEMCDDVHDQIEVEEHTKQETLRRSTRVKKTPTFLEDYYHSIMALPCNEDLKKARYYILLGLPYHTK